MYEDFKIWLDWKEEEDRSFFDREGVSLLGYAVCSNNLKVAKYILDEITTNFSDDNALEKRRRIESRISKKGYLHFGISGSCTALIAAMTLASIHGDG